MVHVAKHPLDSHAEPYSSSDSNITEVLDGGVASFGEKLPGVGIAIGMAHALKGDHDRALRATATSLNSCFSTAGAMIGGALGAAGTPLGMVAGAALGGSVGAQVGMFAEWLISKGIQDDSVKGDVGELSFRRAAIDALVGGVGGLMGGGAGITQTGKALGQAAIEASGNVLMKSGFQAVGQQVVKEATKEAGKQMVAGGIAAGFNASRGVFKSTTKEPQTKKKPRRVCTKDQQDQAAAYDSARQKLCDAYPTSYVASAMNNMNCDIVHLVRKGKDWNIANGAVQGAVGMHEIYYNGNKLTGFLSVREGMLEDLDHILNPNVMTLSDHQKGILSLVQNLGRETVVETINALLNLVEERLLGLAELMTAQEVWEKA